MELSMNDLRELIGENGNGAPPFKVGQKLFVRMVNFHITGEVVSISGGFLTLKDAAWIADSGRFSDALKSCVFEEVEPYDEDVYINISAITDSTPIHTLPRTQK